MIKQTLGLLRKKNGYTQEQVAEQIGVSRQAVANWEKGESNPDIEKCIALADLYDVSVDELVRQSDSADIMVVPRDKYFFGTLTVGARGQIVIPKKAREMFQIEEGDQLLLLGDEDCRLAILPKKEMKKFMQAMKGNFFGKEHKE